MTIKVIAEIGINHKGSDTRLKNIIDIAIKSKAWGIKFQYREIKEFYAEKNEIGDEILSKEIEKSNIEFNTIIKYARYAKQKGLKVGISFFKSKDLKNKMNKITLFDFIKIPSPEFNNNDLISLAKSTNKLIFISTGGNQGKDIIKKIKSFNKDKFVVFHCISNYPTMTGFQQLSFIKKLKKINKLKIGYSSHDMDWEINLIAMGLEVDYIERHLTVNKLENGLDESSSSEEKDFKKICFFANNFSNILGHENRYPNQGEIINMQNLGTSYYAKKNINKGKIINLNDFVIKAPRLGLQKKEITLIKNKKLIKSINKNQPLLKSHLVKNSFKFSEKKINFLVENKISIPFRFHDSKIIHETFPTLYNELHLSFGEVSDYDKKKINIEDFLIKEREYTIHLPDYIKNNNIIDPLSNDKNVRDESRKIINTTISLANYISDFTKKQINIVGSFSRFKSNKYKSLDQIFNFLDKFKEENYKILPQWLPKIAWYFGGAEKIILFCDEDDIAYIKKYNKKICLDISHLILSANYQNINWVKWYNMLIKNTSHIHFSDARGIDGEGIEFGSGDLNNIDFVLKNKNVKVLEVWQGHLENGIKFKKAINKLYNEYK